MNQSADYLAPYKQAIIDYIKSNGDFEYDYECGNGLVIIDPEVPCEEHVMDYLVMMEKLGKGEMGNTESDGILIEYVKLEDLVSPLSRDELIAGLMNNSTIRELEAEHSYTLNLHEKLLDELRSLDIQDIYTFTDRKSFLTINPSTREVDFSEMEGGDDWLSYDMEQFVKRSSDFNVPERNIFCGYQFKETPIRAITNEEYYEWRNLQDTI